MKLFVEGRKHVFEELQKNISPEDKIFWIHAASLGEYEQAVPIIEALKKEYPTYKILLSFFSPSGYEVKKHNKLADWTIYLPLDTRSNARKFVKYAHPDMALFIKYEVWPNYLSELKKHQIPALLISGNFRKDQIYFKSQGNFMKYALHQFDHLFVQNKSSLELLNLNGFENVSISGDTRFDRVSAQLQMDNRLDFVENFKHNQLCIVCGSTWPEDENILLDYINSSSPEIKFIIAPHQIKEKQIENLQSKINKPSVIHSQINQQNLENYSVLIIDKVGLLTKIYAYADLAYVGGAAGHTGLHNILEPAAFGIPIVIGKNHQNFPEATQLKKANGLFVVASSKECTEVMQRLTSNDLVRKEVGENAGRFIFKNKGATEKIMNYLQASLKHK